MSKKRGFTLAELLVVIAVTTLVLTMVGGSFIFMTESSGKLIDKSEELAQTQNIEKYVRNFVKQEILQKGDSFTVNSNFILEIKETLTCNNNGDIVVKKSESTDDIVFADTGLSQFFIEIVSNNDFTINDKQYAFYYCYLKYDNGNEYKFILGICEKTSQQQTSSTEVNE